jgi:1,4-dihydroxy-2-naphthoate polyprenyltransferase
LNIKAWIAASRLPAQIFMFPAVLLGQALHFSLTGEFALGPFISLVIYGLAMHFFIVYINDVADFETDQKNTTFTPFSGGSRVLVEGKLTKRSLLVAGLIMAGIVLFIGNLMAVRSGEWTLMIWVVLGLFLMHAYSFGPIKLSYRGFGEVLQMLGVGVVLPVVGYLAQGGSYDTLPWLFIVALLPSQYAMAISTSLPDEPSDKESQKRTTVVILGVKNAKRVMLMLYALAIAGVTLLSTTDSAFIFLIFGLVILFVQIYIYYNKRPKPGDFSMFIFVSLAILLNTVLVLGWSLTFLFTT